MPQEVLDAVSALGRRLHERGAIRPVCLLGAEDARDAGNALLATMALDLLDRPGLLDGEQAILLELLLRAPGRAPAPGCTGCCATATGTYASTSSPCSPATPRGRTPRPCRRR
ncbi:hypothetical protein ACFQ2K_40880 [Streptomyces sanglieri]|uniref:Uncharacterized protein n=1 Tax=Streptomyces sanglieri TaxID=193460 RepID=A0ABW2X4V5_9ACTN